MDIPGYTIIRELGQGGMASVVLANQECVDRKVALKILDQNLIHDTSFCERFVREAKIIANLSHPNIVSVFEAGNHENNYYLVMKYYPGGDLKTRIKNGMQPRESLVYLKQLSKALGFAHREGYVHRDIKPENILFDANDVLVLSDFGIAKAQKNITNMTQMGAVIGTPRYMSPEQAQGSKLDTRSDIYSLGVVLYEMLTGKVPFDSDSDMAIGIMHINDPIPRLPETIPDYDAYQLIIDKLLAKNPNDRYQSAEALIGDIDRFDNIGNKTKILTPVSSDGNTDTVVVNHSVRLKSPSGFSRIIAPDRAKVVVVSSAVLVLILLIAFVYQIMQNHFINTGRNSNDNQSSEAIKKVSVDFTSIPSGSVVKIDGKKIGITPIERYQLSNTIHQIELEHEMYLKISESLDLSGEFNPKQHYVLDHGNIEHAHVNSGEIFRDELETGGYGPLLIAIPASHFIMGDLNGIGKKHELPVHEVRFSKSFAVGITEVTFSDFDKFSKSTGRDKLNDLGWGRDSKPAVGISWSLAKEYVKWLSSQTGYNYRLPTEAEWEFVARGLTDSDYFWGNGLRLNSARCIGCNGSVITHTADVATYEPNEFGIYDMHGNVMEWVEDCWNGTYKGIIADGSAAYSGDCSSRVLRGGSWFNQPGSLRSSARFHDNKDMAHKFYGFRVVREL